MSVQAPSKENPRSVTLLGATGSIGGSTMDLIKRNPEAFAVEAVTANTNVAGLVEAAQAVGAKLAVVADDAAYSDLKDALAGTDIEAAAGEAAVVEAAARPSDFVMAGIVGAAGLHPTLAAVQRGAVVALANKECLVCAGDIFMAEVERHGATLLPCDSEHNAIYQVLEPHAPDQIDEIILTASGGPFRNATLDEMRAVTPAQAVAHPNWDMGAKISVDSATMMNKGLELIEAYHLFPVEEGQISILVHPQSVIHSLVAYKDGSVLAQLGSPDMRIPISYCLGWPERLATPSEKLKLADIARLEFEAPDPVRFPALDLTRSALRAGRAAPTVLNAANEVAVAAFLAGRIGFLDIAAIVGHVLGQAGVAYMPIDDLEAVMAVDSMARAAANELINKQ